MTSACPALSYPFALPWQARERRLSGRLSASPRPDSGEEQHTMSHDSEDRLVRAKVDPSAPVATMGQDDLTVSFSGALRRAFGQTDAAVKRIMRAANCNERAAKNWLAGRNAPNALYLLRLMAAVPEFQGEVRRLTAMQDDIDPEFERDFLKLWNTYQGRRNGAP